MLWKKKLWSGLRRLGWTRVQRKGQDTGLIRVAKVGFSENTSFEQRLEGSE